MKTKSANYKKLSRRLLKGIILFAVIIIISASLFVGPYTYYSELDDCEDAAFSYAMTAAALIDGDKAISYLTPVGTDKKGNPVYSKDEYYKEIMSYMIVTLDECDLMKYFYVYVPANDKVIYIWDAFAEGDNCDLGEAEGYMKGEKEAVDRVFNRNPVEKIERFKDPTYGDILSAFYPIYNNKGKPVAVVGVDFSMDNIKGEVLSYVINIDIIIVVMTFITIVIGYLVIRRKLVKPIQELNTATKIMVDNLDNNNSFDLDINTRDELEELADSFGKMNDDLRDYLKKLASVTAEKERIGAELNIAAQIQENMLPRSFPPYPDRKEFDLYASMTPAKEVGGDFYDFFFVDDNHLALVMADVSGKGVPAALFMAISKTLIKNRAQMGGTPAEILYDINNQLCEGNDAELFVTVWLAILDIRTGKGMAANAGHEHPALMRRGGKFELVEYKHSPMVAFFEDVKFDEHKFELHPGDRLFVYTDGVPEATDSDNELFRTGRMIDVLNKNKDAELKELLSNMKKEIDSFVGDAPQFDDVTMLCLDYFGSEEKE